MLHVKTVSYSFVYPMSISGANYTMYVRFSRSTGIATWGSMSARRAEEQGIIWVPKAYWEWEVREADAMWNILGHSR